MEDRIENRTHLYRGQLFLEAGACQVARVLKARVSLGGVHMEGKDAEESLTDKWDADCSRW